MSDRVGVALALVASAGAALVELEPGMLAEVVEVRSLLVEAGADVGAAAVLGGPDKADGQDAAALLQAAGDELDAVPEDERVPALLPARAAIAGLLWNVRLL